MQTTTDYHRLRQITANYCRPQLTIQADHVLSRTTAVSADHHWLPHTTIYFYRLPHITTILEVDRIPSGTTAYDRRIQQHIADYHRLSWTTADENRLLQITKYHRNRPRAIADYCRLTLNTTRYWKLPQTTTDYSTLPQTNAGYTYYRTLL